MQRYKNISGESGVVAYQMGLNSIVVKFTGGDSYLYTKKSAGAANVTRMQKLAQEGSGLSTFISQNVHDRYEKKLT